MLLLFDNILKTCGKSAGHRQQKSAEERRCGPVSEEDFIHEDMLIQQVLKLGACRVAVIPVSKIHFSRDFRAMCESNACGNFGKCWMCPPDIGEIDSLIEEARGYQKVLVYQTAGRLKDSYDFQGMMHAGKLHNRLSQRISQAFSSLPFHKLLHLSAGGCRVCPVCAKRTGEPCRHPEKAISSLEAYGIAVSELADACGMNYTGGENTVTYFGAFFFDV